MSTSMPSITEPSGYALEPLREGSDFTLYRGGRHGDAAPVLAIALTAEHPSPQFLRRLEHEYSLAAELDPVWAAKPVALTRHEGRMVLVFMDQGGEPLDLVLEQNTLGNQGRLRDSYGSALVMCVFRNRRGKPV